MSPNKILAGRYELLEKLGEGGMGKVFKARDLKLDRIVALKGLGRTDPTDLGRFSREARMAANLRHANCVEVYDLVSEADHHFITMRYVPGASLEALIESGDRPLKEMVEALAQAADGLDHAHHQGIIHRDIKPSNILVEPSGRGCLTDFGLARRQVDATRFTKSGMVLGTPAYMAPEQARGGDKHVDALSDIYGLGATLYQVLAGHPPFKADTALEIFQQVVNAEPPPPPGPPDLAVICLKALSKEKSQRYRSAAEFSRDLRRWINDEAILARPPSTVQRVRRFVIRRRVAVTSIAATLLLATLVILAGRSVSRSSEFQRRRDEASSAFRRERWQDARTAALRALELGADPELQKIADESARKIAGKELEDRRRLAGGDAYRRLQERLAPVAGIIRETRLMFYIPDVDLPARLRKVEEALVELQELALEAEAVGDPEPWILAGMGWYFVGDFRRSEEALKGAPNDGRAKFYLGKILLERSMAGIFEPDRPGTRARTLEKWTAGARGLFDSASAGSEEVDRHIAAAYLAFSHSEYPDVIRMCGEGRRKFPDALGSEEFWLLEALAGSRENERVEACSQAIRRRPHYAWAYFLRGTIEGDRGAEGRAIEDMTRAIAINPRFCAAYNNRAIYRSQVGDPDGFSDYTKAVEADPTNARPYYNRGNEKRRRGDFDGAIADYNEAQRLDPAYTDALNNRAVAKRGKKDFTGAIEDTTQAMGRDPKNEFFILTRAQTRKAMGDSAAAFEDYERALAINSRNAEVHMGLGTHYRDLGRHPEALAALSKAIEYDPRYSEAYANRGLVRAAMGDMPGSLADCEEAVKIDPRSAAGLTNRGNARRAMGDLDGALADYDRSIAVDPTKAETFNSRAALKLAKGLLPEAELDCDEAIRLGPKMAEPYLNRGAIRDTRGNKSGAREDYDRSIALDPNRPEVWYNRGILRLEAKDEGGALVDMDRAIELRPRYPNALYARASLHYARRDVDKTKADLRSALECAPPTWSRRRSVEEMLKTLEKK